MTLVSCNKDVEKEQEVKKALNDYYGRMKGVDLVPDIKVYDDTIYIPVVKQFGGGDSVAFEGYFEKALLYSSIQYVNIKSLHAESLKIKIDYCKILDNKIAWSTTAYNATVFKDKSKIISLGRTVPKFTFGADGFGFEDDYKIGTLTYRDKSIIQLISRSAPCYPDCDSYSYYIVEGDSAFLIENRFNQIFNVGESSFVELSENCIETIIPVEIDLEKRCVVPIIQDSAIFVTDNSLFDNFSNRFLEEGDEIEGGLPIKIYSKPSLNSQYQVVDLSKVTKVEVLNSFFPQFIKGDYDTFWLYVKLDDVQGWIADEDKEAFYNLAPCG